MLLVMKKIDSFTVDHTKLEPGIYISRRDGDVVTYDLRMRKPNSGEYMDNSTMHSLEHMFATYVRNSDIADKVIYFGPMGCQTGFYLLTRELPNGQVLQAVKGVLEQIAAHRGEVFGASAVECGNYLNLDLERAQIESRRYLGVLKGVDDGFGYNA